MPIMGRHSGVLTQVFEYARAVNARHIAIDGHRGATRLDDGSVLTERAEMAELRAREVAKLLVGAGLATAAIAITWSAELATADGDGDWRARRVTVRVEP
jgi:outer membrane protein OmpA-like peptidoglycan-associated protein